MFLRLNHVKNAPEADIKPRFRCTKTDSLTNKFLIYLSIFIFTNSDDPSSRTKRSTRDALKGSPSASTRTTTIATIENAFTAVTGQADSVLLFANTRAPIEK